MTEDEDSVRKDWTVQIAIDEYDGRTRATATLRGRDQETTGIGLARCNPDDPDVADIGDELAVARALAALVQQLRTSTVHDITESTNQPVAVLR